MSARATTVYRCNRRSCGSQVQSQVTWAPEGWFTVIQPTGEMLHFCHRRCLDHWSFVRNMDTFHRKTGAHPCCEPCECVS